MRFDVIFKQTDQRINVKFNANNVHFDAAFNDIQLVSVTENVEYYTGDYSVIPSPSPVVLPTEHKLMKSDVTVQAIPTFNVGNTSGGTTFYIATMDEL